MGLPTPLPPREDAHLPPPTNIRALHKALQKAPAAEILPILDLSSEICQYHRDRLKLEPPIAGHLALFPHRATDAHESSSTSIENVPVYTHTSVPGLKIIPSLLPSQTQKELLHRLLSRDLCNPAHKTNLHAHYQILYSSPPCSFFDLPAETLLLPLDPSVHKVISVRQMLNKKLRWMTLGGQYDWTKKVYPEKARGEQAPFPPDIAALLHGMFPDMNPEAAIANFYSPGDQLSPHRDVSESSSAALVSISVGCSALFLISPDPTEDEPDPEVLVIKLNSGDAVVMDGRSRWAWHSVPKVLKDSCPDWLLDWPATEAWHGWMAGKRINLNVRQMWD